MWNGEGLFQPVGTPLNSTRAGYLEAREEGTDSQSPTAKTSATGTPSSVPGWGTSLSSPPWQHHNQHSPGLRSKQSSLQRATEHVQARGSGGGVHAMDMVTGGDTAEHQLQTARIV